MNTPLPARSPGGGRGLPGHMAIPVSFYTWWLGENPQDHLLKLGGITHLRKVAEWSYIPKQL